MMGLFFTQDLSQGQLQKLFTTVVTEVNGGNLNIILKIWSTRKMMGLFFTQDLDQNILQKLFITEARCSNF